MHARLLTITLLLATGCSFSGCTTPSSPTAENTPGKPAAAVPSDKDMPFPKLEKGMAADAIRQKLGVPAEIQPMPSAEGKAEVWIYRYEKYLGTSQIASSTRDIPVTSMAQNSTGTSLVQEPVYTTVTRKQEITLSLLMFNDKLQVQKAKVEEKLDNS